MKLKIERRIIETFYPESLLLRFLPRKKKKILKKMIIKKIILDAIEYNKKCSYSSVG